MVDEPAGPVVTPAGHGARQAWKAVGLVALFAVAYAAFYFFPRQRTAEDDRARQEANQSSTSTKVGDPGKQFRKPGYDEVPQQEARPVVAEKPSAQAAGPAVVIRRRPQGSDISTWTAPKPTPAAVETAAEKPAKPENDGRPTKLAGLPVMQAERIDDPSWYLMPGEMIMCRNDQPLTEKTGAFWTATIPEEKLSKDGTRRLIPAGSKAFGKIVTGFQNGDRRLAGVMTHIAGPSAPGKPMLFVPIDMGQVGDDLGRVDMDGNIENNFWPRLLTVGAYAALDMVARGGTSYATGSLNRALNGGNDGVNVNVGSFGGMGTGQSLAGTAMTEELRKQPGFSRPESQPCTIMVTKPIDFRRALQIGK